MTDQWELGRRMEQGRLAAGLSKRQAAKRAGISDGRWRQLEAGVETIRGKTFPVKTTPETVARIASALQQPVDELLEVAGFDPDSVADVGPSGLGVEVVDVSGLPTADVEKVQAFVEFLKSQNDAHDSA
ncbi:helix-turn-helix domain-containing protein [Nocardia wallacei]|uniref:helix-turn-helix domain-containing protein n=1 Tax=Nocardia wallacei TaxID=480035 RepID=UPI0024573319|nr:helix-turn-helix transcriptional regulator [Nocardia wallacei]